MKLTTKLRLLAHIAKWRLTWRRHDLDYVEPGVKNPKFVSARRAAEMIPDGACVISSGMAGNTRCSIFFWAIRERFERTGNPKGLTWITVGAQGSRGRVPGTVEELALPGLVSLYVGGHVETAKAMLRTIDAGRMDLQVLPQGQMVFALEGQGRGEGFVESDTAVGTFLDPRCGTGPVVVGNRHPPLIEPAGDGRLRFRLPKITAAVFTAPAADVEGNLYLCHAAMFTESRESAYAARKNGGVVLAAVAELVPKNEKEIFLPASMIDAVVVNPFNEQTGSVPQRDYWPMFTTAGDGDVTEGIEILRFANRVLGITPRRGAPEQSIARLAARVFTRVTRRGALVNIGVGLPEEVCRLIYESELYRDVTFSTETGVVGGLPAPGIFFGAAVNPGEMVSSAEVFHRYYDRLDTALFGALQVDAGGNVNVSKRGAGALNYVGPGGLPDIAAAAKSIVFVTTWMAHADIRIEGGRVRVRRPGPPKFIPRVDEVTFSGPQALAKGKTVYYATNVGLFRLTPRGMELCEVMPGIDVQRDILDAIKMRVLLPEDGGIPVVDASIVTGKGFRLSWEGAAPAVTPGAAGR